MYDSKDDLFDDVLNKFISTIPDGDIKKIKMYMYDKPRAGINYTKYINKIRMAVNETSMEYLEYDGKSYPCGIPVDLTEDGSSPKIGWVSDKDKTEDEKLKLDKAMHNRGYLKGPLTQTEGSSKSNIARDQSNHLRRIVATENLNNGTDYYIRFRSVDETAKEFMFDYLELCPKEVYDNPAVQEDRL